MAGCREEHEGVPYGVLEAKPLPDVKDDADRVEKAAGSEPPHGGCGQFCEDRLVKDEPAPTKSKVKQDRQSVETSGQGEFQSDAKPGDGPDAGEETWRRNLTVDPGQERRVGAGDQQVDC